MTYKPFSVVVVPFPFTDTPKTKRRPALVLSSERFQKANGHVTLAMITSAKHSDWLGDVAISELGACGLSAPSVIRQKLFTIDMRLVEKRIGKLEAADQDALQKVMGEHLC